MFFLFFSQLFSFHFCLHTLWPANLIVVPLPFVPEPVNLLTAPPSQAVTACHKFSSSTPCHLEPHSRFYSGSLFIISFDLGSPSFQFIVQNSLLPLSQGSSDLFSTNNPPSLLFTSKVEGSNLNFKKLSYLQHSNFTRVSHHNIFSPVKGESPCFPFTV